MNETDVRQEVYRLLRELSYWPITQTNATKCPRCGSLATPPIGRPDILILHPCDQDYVCEVKTVRKGHPSFSLDEIRPEQRRWLNAWMDAGGLGFLALGTLEAHHRRLWLTEWTAWRQLEEAVTPYQNSIPVIAGKGFCREMQEQHLDLVTQLQGWELTRITGGWELLPTHPLWRPNGNENKGERN